MVHQVVPSDRQEISTHGSHKRRNWPRDKGSGTAVWLKRYLRLFTGQCVMGHTRKDRERGRQLKEPRCVGIQLLGGQETCLKYVPKGNCSRTRGRHDKEGLPRTRCYLRQAGSSLLQAAWEKGFDAVGGQRGMALELRHVSKKSRNNNAATLNLIETRMRAPP